MQLKEYFWVPKEEQMNDPSRVGLAQLAFPIILENVLRSTVGMVDVLFLSRVSDAVVSAVSVSNQFIMFCYIISMAMANGATVCINQAIGMKNMKKVNLLATIAVVANAVVGVLFGLVFLCTPGTLLKIMTLDAEATDAACKYLMVCGGLMVFQTVEIVVQNICRSMGKIRAPLVISFFSNIVNVVGNYLAIYHPEYFFNLEPVVGVAVATVLSRFVALVISVVIAGRCGLRCSLKYLNPFPKESFRLVLSIGIPSGINMMAYSLSQIVTSSIISMLGISMLAAKVYVSNIVQYVAIIGMSFSSASTIMVGYRIGAGEYEEANKIRSIVTAIALISNGLISLIILAARYPLLGMFTQDPEIIALASSVFFIDFFVEIGRALNNSLSGALQAAGDVKFQLIVNQASAWIVAVGGSYLLAIVLGLGLNGIWISFACDELTRGLILLYRWKSGAWMAGAEQKRSIIADDSV